MTRLLRGFVLASAVLGLPSIDAVADPMYPGSGVQTGLASYYGPGFDGRQAANGEVFDQRELVAAHRTLPFDSVVRVTNLENGRSVVVRVIDRGPYGRNHCKGCIIDLSRGAARRLQFLREGLVRVRVQILRLGQ